MKQKKEKEKGIMDIASSYSLYTAKGSCFAKLLSKTDSASSANPFHQHSHS
jgi:predicted solute-binding protein